MTASIYIPVALVAVLLSSIAVAQTSDEQGSCMSDAFRVCWRDIPNRHEVFLCLLKNRKQLSPICRVAMDREWRARKTGRSADGQKPGGEVP